MPTNTGRNAVVLIHGMGEQRPIETLRDFVTALTKRFNVNKLEG
jgi:hypothetical protein